MIQPQYLWQVGMVGATGTATVTGVLVGTNGETTRFSVSVTTTANSFKNFWGGTWTGFKKMLIYSVTGSAVHVNLGARNESAAAWVTQAPTTADEKIEVGDYSTDPLVIEALQPV